MIRRLAWWCGLLLLALVVSTMISGGTRVEVDLDSGQTRTSKEIVGLPIAHTRVVSGSGFYEIPTQGSQKGLMGLPNWKVAQSFRWWNRHYSAQYEFSWVLRMVRELDQLCPLLDAQTRASIKREFLVAVRSNDSDKARITVETARRHIADR